MVAIALAVLALIIVVADAAFVVVAGSDNEPVPMGYVILSRIALWVALSAYWIGKYVEAQ